MLMIILAILGGVLTTLSMITNSALGKRIGEMQSTLVNYVVGLLCSLVVLVIMGNKMSVSLEELSTMPFYIFLGGAIGVLIVFSSNKIIPKIPVVYSMLLMFIGQIVCGAFLDYFLLGELSFKKVIGALVITLGILYNTMIDKIEQGYKK